MKGFLPQKAYLVCMVIMSVFVSILSGCGGGGGGHWNEPPGSVVSVVSIAVTPAAASIPVNFTQQYKAMATLSDGSPPLDVTASSTWTSGTTGVTFGVIKGLATGVTANVVPVVITASYGGKSGTANLTVTSATVLSIIVTPATASIPVNGTQPFKAMATLSDGSPPLDVTTNPGTVWHSANSGVATFGVPPAVITGIATGVAPGTSDITATFSTKTSLAGTAILTVTAIPVPPPALAINLGRAASFGIASRAGLTSTGVTVVNGNIALSPTATCSDATGGPGSSNQSCLVQPVYATTTGMTVNGSIFWAGDPFDSGVTASNVTTDLTAAWNEGMGKVNTQPPIAAGELGGKTFIPGIYENANLTLSAGGVATLDAQNDPNAIFIFKTTLGGDFVDSGTLLLPSRIVLLNQAQARNVWFVIGRDATIGSGTTWSGNILANRTVTVLDGSTVNGRVLGGAGGAGAISLIGAAAPSRTTITVPQ